LFEKCGRLSFVGKIAQNTKWGQAGAWTPFIFVERKEDKLLKVETLGILNLNF
jgi:hypothetical protein